MRIDAHQHFWNYTDSMAWITPEMSAIRKSFLPVDLEPLLQQHDVDGCVAVQADQTMEETDFLLSLAATNDFIKGVVGWIDLHAVNIDEQLSAYKAYAKLKGFRHILQAEAPEFMLTPGFINGMAALGRFGFTYDILIYPQHLKAALQLVQQFPHQPFVIDHLAKPTVKSGEIATWEKDIRAMATCENVYCKISGMVTEADWQHWTKDDFRPYLDVVTEAFGAGRIMYGSDWPVCLVAASYGKTIDIVRDYFSYFSNSEKEAVFGRNATEFYHL